MNIIFYSPFEAERTKKQLSTTSSHSDAYVRIWVCSFHAKSRQFVWLLLYAKMNQPDCVETVGCWYKICKLLILYYTITGNAHIRGYCIGFEIDCKRKVNFTRSPKNTNSQ